MKSFCFTPHASLSVEKLICWTGLRCGTLLLLTGLLPGPALGQGYFFSTLAGSPGVRGTADGVGSSARFNYPTAVAVDGAGNVFVTDHGHAIRKISPDRTVITFAGLAGTSGSNDATGNAARFYGPQGLAVDGAGYLLVADTLNHTIRKITPAGVVTTLAGVPGISGSADGPALESLFTFPSALAVDGTGNVYVVERQKYTIRKITADGLVTTLAGLTGTPVSANSLAGYNGLTALAVDASGNIFVINTEWFSTDIDASPASTLQMIAPETEINPVFVGAGAINPILIGELPGYPTYNGFYLGGLAFGPSGDLFLTNAYGADIRIISPSGDIAIAAGTAWYVWGSADGQGTAARFNFPEGIAVDRAGNLYVADSENHTIRVGRLNGFFNGLVITKQPNDQVVVVGGSAVFAVEAAGQPAPAYQWFRNSAAINGATGPTLKIDNVQPSDHNSVYTVAVTNIAGSETSRAATLTVTAPVVTPSPPPAPTGSSSGGGGAPSGWFLGALSLLFAARRWRHFVVIDRIG